MDVVLRIKRMFVFIFLLFTPLLSYAIYDCPQNEVKPIPKIIGDKYTVARESLIKSGWEPVEKSWLAIPEAESCNFGDNLSCDFVFKNNSSGYGLVIQATSEKEAIDLIVSGYYLRCHP
jgi:hypothetical protein